MEGKKQQMLALFVGATLAVTNGARISAGPDGGIATVLRRGPGEETGNARVVLPDGRFIAEK